VRDVQAIADRVEIEALRGEFTDAQMDDYDRFCDAVRAEPQARRMKIMPASRKIAVAGATGRMSRPAAVQSVL
jgi:hypothetical protein